MLYKTTLVWISLPHKVIFNFSYQAATELLSLSFFFPAGTYTSGDLDLFLPLKNSGKALRSMAWTLKQTRKKKNIIQSKALKGHHHHHYLFISQLFQKAAQLQGFNTILSRWQKLWRR